MGSADLRVGTEKSATAAPAGHVGHGRTTSLRRQPAWIAAGQMEDVYTGAFEVICCDCGDRPDWDYAEVSFQLQRIRGPYPLAEGIVAFGRHIGLTA
jgi:hypothetical protein